MANYNDYLKLFWKKRYEERMIRETILNRKKLTFEHNSPKDSSVNNEDEIMIKFEIAHKIKSKAI